MALAELPLPLLGKDTPGLLADNEEEYFDVVDDDNQIIGCEKRSDVHATGLKHRAVYCFVFNQQRKLLMQQRSPRQAPLHLHPMYYPGVSSNPCVRLRQREEAHTLRVSCRKKIGPLQWDLSVAEHLQPGESYREVDDLPLNQGHMQVFKDEKCPRNNRLRPLH